jgi:hypothetical protein
VWCAPDGPAKYFWVLGRFRFETFLRLACLGWLCQTLCSYARSLGVSTLHTFKINKFLVSSSTDPAHRNYSYDVIDDCRMDLPRPTTSVGTRTDYSVGPWDYPTCAARYLMA